MASGGGDPRRVDPRALVAAVFEQPAVVEARAIVDDYGRAGGGLLAGGLAFAALFALVPSVLVVLGVVGLVVGDVERRTAIVEELAGYVPPLRGLFEQSLAQMARDAGSVSLVGFAGLVWGSSRFYEALEEAFARLFAAAPRRGFVRRTALGIVAVGLLLAAVVGAVALTAIASFLESSLAAQLSGVAAVWRFLSPALAAVAVTVAVAVVYRLLPAGGVTWAALAVPSVVVGLALAILTEVFVYVAPRLVGVAAVYGAFGAGFAALAWLALGFQVLLLGGVWVRRRSARS